MLDRLPRLLHPSTRNSVCGRRFHYRVTASLRGASDGMLTVSSICIASRLIIRHRLTPGRTTLPGNPWSYGGGESHPPYRYLYLHLLFHLDTTSGPWPVVWILLLSGTDVSTRPLSPGIHAAAFGVRQDLTGGEALASYRSLYLRGGTRPGST